MRVALLSMTEPTAGGPVRAHLRVGAMTLAHHQLALVLALGCERIICLAPAFDADLMALQHVAEGAGASFHVVSGTRGLAALVSAADEVVALAEGLLAWPQIAVPLLDEAPAVLVQPIETGLAAGFERIDINHAGGGAMRVPGRLVERLSELPADADPFAALQRIALQAGVGQRMVPGEAGANGQWALVVDESQAHAVEAVWIRLHTRYDAPAPGLAAARYAVRLAGPALLHAGSGGRAVGIAALVLALLALVSGWFGYPTLGFVLCMVSWVLFLASALLGKVEREALSLRRTALDRAEIFGWIMDAVLVLLMSWGMAPGGASAGMMAPAGVATGHNWVARGLASVMLLGLMRMVPPLLERRQARWGWTHWLGDRSLLALVLGVASALGLIGEAVDAGSLVLLALGIAAARRGDS